MSGPSPHPGPCMPLLLLIAPVGPPHSPEKIQNILSEATWPQEKIGANRIRHVVQLIQTFPPHQNADLGTAKYFFFKKEKCTTSFLWFLYPNFRQAWAHSPVYC